MVYPWRFKLVFYVCEAIRKVSNGGLWFGFLLLFDRFINFSFVKIPTKSNLSRVDSIVSSVQNLFVKKKLQKASGKKKIQKASGKKKDRKSEF